MGTISAILKLPSLELFRCSPFDHSQRILPVSVTPNIPSEQAKQVKVAPATLGSALKHGFEKIETCYRTVYGGVRCYNSGWYNWGRWLLLGLIIFFFIMTLCCLSWSSRRKRARGARPMYGTGWMSQGPLAPPPYQAHQQAAPPYSTYDNSGNNYAPQQPKPTYGGQGQNYEMNNGANSSYYNSGSNDYGHNQYAPPSGPPPNQHSGVIR